MNTKLKYFFLLIIIGLFTSCSKDSNDIDPSEPEYVQIPDTNFEKKLISFGIDSDGVVNQRILKSDAASVDYLNLLSESIHDEIYDLKGIEGFVNLKRLFASGNQLTEVDLSKNILLDSLVLRANFISTIDLFNNSKLLYIDLLLNNLTSISGLSSATNLKRLNLSHNLFEEYTIENPSLANILMSHNELVSFDTSAAVNLESIYMPTNKITELDLSNNTLLERLNVGNNKLTQINFGEIEKITYISCFSNFLSALDVSNYEALWYLSANRNPNLSCIKIVSGQNIATLKLSDYQQVNVNCN